MTNKNTGLVNNSAEIYESYNEYALDDKTISSKQVKDVFGKVLEDKNIIILYEIISFCYKIGRLEVEVSCQKIVENAKYIEIRYGVIKIITYTEIEVRCMIDYRKLCIDLFGTDDPEKLKAIAQKAASKGIIVVFRMWNKGFDGGKNEKAFNLLKENISGEWAENTRGIRIRDKIHIEYGERFEWPDIHSQIKGEKFSCYALKDQFGILADGTVVPCCLDSDGVINLGNIFCEDIATILNSEKAVNIVNGFKRGTAHEELCKKCGYAQRFV